MKSHRRFIAWLTLTGIALAAGSMAPLHAQTWQPGYACSYDSITHVLISHAGTLAYVTYSGRVVISEDRGDTWVDRSLGLPRWTATAAQFHPNGTLFIGGWAGLFRSTDNGRSWRVSLEAEVTALAFDSTGMSYAGIVEGVVNWSSNVGESWESFPPGVLNGTPVRAMCVDRTGRLYVGLGENNPSLRPGDVFFSDSLGSFRRAHPARMSLVIKRLGVLRDGTVIAAADVPPLELFRGLRDDAAWKTLATGLSSSQDFESLLIDDDDAIYADIRGQLLRTRDLFKTTETISLPRFGHIVAHDQVTDELFSAADQTLLTSSDRGATWREIPLPTAPTIHSFHSDPYHREGYVYLATRGGGLQFNDGWYYEKFFEDVRYRLGDTVEAVLVDLDQQRTWVGGRDGLAVAIGHPWMWYNVRGSPTGSRITALHQLPDSTILCGMASGRLHRSTDHGTTWWLTADLGGRPVRWIRRSPRGGVVAAFDSILVRSFDAGASWAAVPALPAVVRQIGLTLEDNLLIATDGGTFLAGDFDGEWRRLDGPLGTNGATAFEVAQNGRVYAASGRQLFGSDDHGRSWVRIPCPVRSDITSIAFDPRTGNVCVTTNSSSLLVSERFSLPVVGAPQVSDDEQEMLVVHESAARLLHVRYQLDKPATVRVELFSSRGDRVASVASMHSRHGLQRVCFDTHQLARGAYVCRLISDGRVSQRIVVID